MCALYAFARITDDLGDSDQPVEKRTALLHWWRSRILAHLKTDNGDQPLDSKSGESIDLSAEPAQTLAKQINQILPALEDTCRRYSLPSKYLLEIIDGVLADQQKTRFDTYEQLEHYCYLVASAVGLACLHIWEFDGPLPEKAAIDLGLAFQLTNILRDISEDAGRGRIYLPRQHYESHGLCEDDLLQPRGDDRLCQLILDETKRAEELYRSGWQVWDSLSNDGRPMFSMMWRTYRTLLSQIEQDPRAVAQRRIRISTRERLSLVAQHFLPPFFHSLPIPPVEIACHKEKIS